MDLPYWSAAPFALLLGSVVVLPIFAENWWHANRNKAIVVAVLASPTAAYLVWLGQDTTYALIHELEDYGSFIAMLLSLYVISGGIVLRGRLGSNPASNTALLAVGAVLANLIGTTGASMVLIRPLLRANAGRSRKAHIPVFFIFIVSNTGGLLTPLGDPPLFLGFLQGVDFFWTLRLWPEWLMVNASLLAIFFVRDTYSFRREAQMSVEAPEPLSLAGAWINVPLLVGVIAAVIGQKYLPKPAGEVAMLVLTGLSLLLTPRGLRTENAFRWGPMIEVAVLFLGIFTTMVPALLLLKEHGGKVGVTQPWEYFWLTGLLSSVLDNAPTYLTIGTLAANGNPLAWLMTNKPGLLAAISCGAVFMGANTYIGNGPNFMVKAIAEEAGTPMPSFFGYLYYSALILMPLFVIVTFVFFV